jgi:hypothetical protein
MQRDRGYLSGKESNDLLRNEFARVFERKVTGIQQMKLGFRDISQICLGALDSEERIVLSPHDQRLRLFVPKEFMPALIERKVRLVVLKQIKLDRVVTPAIKKELVHGV